MKRKELGPLFDHLRGTVIGSEDSARLLLTALLAKGHVLIEGAPGIGKTSLGQALAFSMGGIFKRVQFTPDLMPSDLVGYHLYRAGKEEFEFIPGPVFSNCLLADEINRTSPRVQSALLESMNEGRVSIDGVTRDLPDPFMVIATQNEQFGAGTFPLPEPQLDRFLLSFEMQLPDEARQIEILTKHGMGKAEVLGNGPLMSLRRILQLQEEAGAVPASEAISAYVVALCEKLRRLAGSRDSVSVRASIALLRAARANAYLASDEAVYPDHVQAVFPAVMRHRILAESPVAPAELIRMAMSETPVP